MFGGMVTNPREVVGEILNPNASALFETSAELTGGLRKATEDYERCDERALP